MTGAGKRPTKQRWERALERYLFNPTVLGLGKLGLRTSLASELETIGRRTGQVRRVPVSAQFDAAGAWVISQHGTASGWGSNVVANPSVRLRQGKRWRTGIAQFRPDDDVVARSRRFGSIGAQVVKALVTTPVPYGSTSLTDIISKRLVLPRLRNAVWCGALGVAM